MDDDDDNDLTPHAAALLTTTNFLRLLKSFRFINIFAFLKSPLARRINYDDDETSCGMGGTRHWRTRVSRTSGGKMREPDFTFDLFTGPVFGPAAWSSDPLPWSIGPAGPA